MSNGIETKSDEEKYAALFASDSREKAEVARPVSLRKSSLLSFLDKAFGASSPSDAPTTKTTEQSDNSSLEVGISAQDLRKLDAQLLIPPAVPLVERIVEHQQKTTLQSAKDINQQQQQQAAAIPVSKEGQTSVSSRAKESGERQSKQLSSSPMTQTELETRVCQLGAAQIEVDRIDLQGAEIMMVMAMNACGVVAGSAVFFSGYRTADPAMSLLPASMRDMYSTVTSPASKVRSARQMLLKMTTKFPLAGVAIAIYSASEVFRDWKQIQVVSSRLAEALKAVESAKVELGTQHK